MAQTIKSLSTHLSKRLSNTLLNLEQCWFEIELMIGHVLSKDRTWIALHPETQLSEEQINVLSELVERRIAYEPLAYLFQEAPFFGNMFFVDQRVLIPRPETEQLVKLAIEYIASNQTNWAVWDVGTGSGCIALSIAHTLPQVHVLASDQSESALTVAQKNAELLKLQNTTFIQGSLLTREVEQWLKQQRQKHWLITANLPYLPEQDAPTMQKQVADYEPQTALFATNNGLSLIFELLHQLSSAFSTRSGDVILLEHDPRQATDLQVFASSRFPHARITSEQDQNGAARFTVLKT